MDFHGCNILEALEDDSVPGQHQGRQGEQNISRRSCPWTLNSARASTGSLRAASGAELSAAGLISIIPSLPMQRKLNLHPGSKTQLKASTTAGFFLILSY
jgi:hypothetical protein